MLSYQTLFRIYRNFLKMVLPKKKKKPINWAVLQFCKVAKRKKILQGLAWIMYNIPTSQDEGYQIQLSIGGSLIFDTWHIIQSHNDSGDMYHKGCQNKPLPNLTLTKFLSCEPPHFKKSFQKAANYNCCFLKKKKKIPLGYLKQIHYTPSTFVKGNTIK